MKYLANGIILIDDKTFELNETFTNEAEAILECRSFIRLHLEDVDACQSFVQMNVEVLPVEEKKPSFVEKMRQILVE